jgi:CheY-like chemotaxis protein
MTKLNILVAEDHERWQKALKETLEDLGGEVTVEIAPDYATALHHIKNQKYDLATVDLSLSGAPPVASDTDLLGMELMREWRTGSHNQGCGLIVLTAYPKLTHTREALLKYGAFDFIEKREFDDRTFPRIARAAILAARLKHAAHRQRKILYFTVNFNEESFVGCKMSGPTRSLEYIAKHPPRLNASDLIRRTDDLKMSMLKGDRGRWRPEANSIGNAIYSSLADDQRIVQDLASARVLPDQGKDLWLEFNGPATGLGIPFELLRDGKDTLSLRHILTRRLVHEGLVSYNTDPFHTFVQRLQMNGDELRLLIVGSNSDGRIPGAEAEAKELKINIEKDLDALGIMYEIKALIGKDATYDNVSDALHSGGYHIFHYAGHGRYTDILPEISSLFLLDNGGKPKPMRAADLNQIVKDSQLQFVFLSCCLSARSAEQPGRGDFSGIIEALALASVPTVLGYRWPVEDSSALLLAKSFYESLWRTFSPAESLSEARSDATRGEDGRDDETWLSPVLLVQNR